MVGVFEVARVRADAYCLVLRDRPALGRGGETGASDMEVLVWGGIALCLSQSAIFSGLNLALLGLSRLRLEAEAESGSEDARRVLEIRRDSNFLLTTVLWGNVAVNTLLTLLSDSVLTGVSAFFFSTFGITAFGEILPQAYFSRNALRIGSRLLPVVRFYRVLLYPVARPSALLLDWWLGREGITFMRERDLRHVIRLHMDSNEAELGDVEGLGALNFMTLDDLAIADEGEPITPTSIIQLPVGDELPIFPDFDRSAADPFIRRVQASDEKWVIIVDPRGEPRLAINADSFLRAALLSEGPCSPYAFAHRPVVIHDPATPLGTVLRKLHVDARAHDDDVIDLDLILLWTSDRRILTGADILGRLLRGIASRRSLAPRAGPGSL